MSELNRIDTKNIFLYEDKEKIRQLAYTHENSDDTNEENSSTYTCWLVSDLDNWKNFAHGNDDVAFSISLIKISDGKGFDIECFDNGEYEVLITCLCLPIHNKIIYSELGEGVFISSESLQKHKLTVEKSTNISIPNIALSTNHSITSSTTDTILLVYQHLSKRNVSYIYSGSIMYDIARLLENKLDICVYHGVSTIYLNIMGFIVEQCGGAILSLEKENLCIIGKPSIVNNIRNINSEIF